jgi:bacterioferritin-associated ferredoxin
VGCTIELFTKTRLSRTRLIKPHTQAMSLLDSKNLQKYIGVSYGCGRCNGRINSNVVNVPNATFSTNDDPTRYGLYYYNGVQLFNCFTDSSHFIVIYTQMQIYVLKFNHLIITFFTIVHVHVL